ncbi:unnamed protein product [Staurois parvus]|uniref:Cyclin-dependent kinase inhibitor 1B n=1 Tax=Staurois parvus TaxID=386267 RepID=A0ABN9DM84_9NEOB|nr:unnamed protein product [Staurois parvus]
MSGVRLSPGSPGVERVSRAPGSPRPLARRCLFGPVDGQSLAREAARYRAKMEEESRARWNFDFSTDRPLDGALQWVEAGPDTPEFYRRPVHRKPTNKRSGPGEGTALQTAQCMGTTLYRPTQCMGTALQTARCMGTALQTARCMGTRSQTAGVWGPRYRPLGVWGPRYRPLGVWGPRYRPLGV